MLTYRQDMSAASSTNLNGTCWCGCKKPTDIGRDFIQGHDKIAEAALIAANFDGKAVNLLRQHGYSPDNSVRQAAVDAGAWTTCPREGCEYTGAPASVRKHAKLPHPNLGD